MIEVYQTGATVQFVNHPEYVGIVTGVQVLPSLLYRISWWSAGTRHEEWFYFYELLFSPECENRKIGFTIQEASG
jgi:hypothetical protein